MCLDLLIDEATGIWQIANQGEVTWATLARYAAELSGLNVHAIERCPTRDDFAALLPAYSVLGSERASLLPGPDVALVRHLHEAATLQDSFRRDGNVSGRDNLIMTIVHDNGARLNYIYIGIAELGP